ncbi:hypothetical protein NTGHW29_380011 [Candidatus Nitrotoga sp. HW29]|nr:hypothetical protein NTGHW29_380011 [Candidatus Nitrotoga sp. HW29]
MLVMENRTVVLSCPGAVARAEASLTATLSAHACTTQNNMTIAIAYRIRVSSTYKNVPLRYMNCTTIGNHVFRPEYKK